MAAVGDFCDRMARLGWQDGERDCLLWLGLWTLEAVGIDGGAEWRGRYRTPLGRTRALNRSGGMMACIERGAAVAGLVEATAAKAGAVGLVEVLTPKGVAPVGGIFTGERWSVLTRSGVLSIRSTPIRCWNLP
jgi:hypothetical protein